MGLFDAFKKKDCEICGKEVGMFGYKKLEDGEICKDCVKLLSPWFDERRHSTVDQIKAQIAYREENRRQLNSFNPAISIGNDYEVKVELENGVPTRFVIARNDYLEENADIINFSQVSSFNIDIRERRDEQKHRNNEGNMVSYNPPRYEYSYDFYCDLMVNADYFDDIRFRLNGSTLNLETVMPQNGGFGNIFINNNFDPNLYPEYREYKAMCEQLEQIFSSGIQGVALPGYAQSAPAAQSAGVEPLLKMIEQIKSAPNLGMVFNLQSEIAHQATNLPEFDWIRVKSLTEAAVEDAKQRIIAQETGSAPVQEAPKPKFCPNCGAPAEGGKFCQSCGTAL